MVWRYRNRNRTCQAASVRLVLRVSLLDEQPGATQSNS